MPSLKKKYLADLKEIMDRYYVDLRENGQIPKEHSIYLDGFMDAALSSGLASLEEVQMVIDEANYSVFGMSIEERKKMYAKIKKEYSEYIDVPAFFRKGENIEI